MKRLLLLSSILALAACSSAPDDDGAVSSESGYTAVTPKPYEGTCSPGDRICGYFAPTDMPVHAILNAMRGATRSIRIATYNINIPEIATVLRERLDAGVEVELMEDYLHAIDDENDPNSVWKLLGEHENLVKYKLPVLRGGTPQMHDKILVIDGARVFFGSANWTFTGLVGNFENVMSVKDPDTVGKFVAELDELEAQGKLACETFATPVDRCGKGGETWSSDFSFVAKEGHLDPAIIDAANPICKQLTDDRNGFFLPGNQPRIADGAALSACFLDRALGDKYAAYASAAAAIEKYVDGTAVKSDPPQLDGYYAKFVHRDTQAGPIRVYFGGEDDVEWQMIRELRSLEETPAESFAYLSTNFITNPRLVKELAKLKGLGVRTRVFFDRGRFDDPHFHSQFETLSKMGFTLGLGAPKVKVEIDPNWAQTGDRWKVTKLDERETEDSLANASVSVFDNDLSGTYGADHNKFAVLGKKMADGRYRVVLLNGSANWSSMAMEQNDENLAVIEDPYAAAIYLREFISQEYVYRYAQDENSAGLAADMAFVSARVPCFDVAMGKTSEACAEWKPNVSGALVMAVRNVPAPLDGSRRVWAWVSNWQSPEEGAQSGRAFELFSANTFAGKWVTSIPYAPGAELRYKFLTTPANVDPNKDGLGAAGIEWEYGGIDNDRRDTLGSRPVLTLHSSNLRWGQP